MKRSDYPDQVAGSDRSSSFRGLDESTGLIRKDGLSLVNQSERYAAYSSTVRIGGATDCEEKIAARQKRIVHKI